MKRSEKSKMGRSIRYGALFSIFAWVISSGLCSSEFLFTHTNGAVAISEMGGQPHDGSRDHPRTDTPPHSHESKSAAGGSCCAQLKSVLSSSSLTVSKPSFGKIFAEISVIETEVSAAFKHDSCVWHQAKGRKWVFTPEVCLGPAFRAHAPPSFV